MSPLNPTSIVDKTELLSKQQFGEYLDSIVGKTCKYYDTTIIIISTDVILEQEVEGHTIYFTKIKALTQDGLIEISVVNMDIFFEDLVPVTD